MKSIKYNAFINIYINDNRKHIKLFANFIIVVNNLVRYYIYNISRKNLLKLLLKHIRYLNKI